MRVSEVSPAGVAFLSDRRFDRGDLVDLTFEDDAGGLIRCRAQVLGAERALYGRTRFAALVTAIGELDQLRLDRLVSRCRLQHEARIAQGDDALGARAARRRSWPARAAPHRRPRQLDPSSAPRGRAIDRAAPRRRVGTLAAVDLTLVTAGESHGPGITAVVAGLPAGLEVDRERMRRDLARRQAGYGRSPRQQLEKDDAEILGGMRHGKTLGGPLALIVRNRDHANWGPAMSAWSVTDEELAAVAARRSRKVIVPRPGHADLAGVMKYDLDDVRNVLERASARETSARVAVGAIAKDLLGAVGIEVHGHVVAHRRRRDAGAAGLAPADFERALASEVGCLDPETEAAMIAEIDAARKDRTRSAASSRSVHSAVRPASDRTPSRACASTPGSRRRPSASRP